MNINVCFPDHEKGRGCDILVKCKDSYVMIEVKSCKLNKDDLDKAVEQFNTTASDYGILNKESIEKIIFHEGKRCGEFSLFTQGCKSHKIKTIYEDKGKEGSKRNEDPTTLYDLIIEVYRRWKNKRR
ncbi:hypothetical protein HRbin04_00349 [archaeon HR04]|nr:hypothetical protein HRbin04_00349 [archaeon HR04]